MTGSRADWVAVGRIITERRRALGLPKNEAARRAGVSNTTWTRLERGENHNPTDATLVRVARVVEIKPEILFAEAGRPAPDPAAGEIAPVMHGTALPSGYPRDRTPYFLGRTDVLANIARYLERWERRVWPMVLTGPPGVGKTEVAARYMADHRDAYDQLGWVNAGSTEAATEDLRKLAFALGAEQVDETAHDKLVGVIVRNLATTQRRLLLVLDGVDHGTVAQESLEAYLPDLDMVRVLITSRRGAGWRRARGLVIGPLRPADAAEFLRQRTGTSSQPPAGEDAAGAEDSAAALAAELGCLPRALDCAGAYVDRAGISLRTFLSLAREMNQRDRLLDLLSDPGAPDDQRNDQNQETATAPWLPNPPAGRHRPAWDLLRILAFLAPEPLDPGVLTSPTVRLPNSLSKLRELPDVRADYLFGSLVRALRRWSLVVADDDSLRVHPITQAAVRRTLDDRQQQTWTNRSLDLLLSVLPIPDGSPADHVACEHLLPHVRAAVRYARLHQADTTIVARLLLRTAEHLRLKGDLDAALRDAKKATRLLDVTGQEGSGGAPAEELVSLRLTRALIHVDFGDFKAARSQLEEASTTPGITPGTVAMVETHRAVIEAQLGRYDSASERIGRVLEYLDQPASSTPQTTTVTSTVALALKLLDEVDDARERFDAAMTMRRALTGTRHHGFALDCYWLASVELRAEQPHRAAYWFQLSLDIFTDLYGAEAKHPRIGDCLRGLAAVDRLAGSPKDALERLDEADAVYQGVFGFEHPVRKSLETTRELLRALRQLQTDRPARAGDPPPEGTQPPPPGAVRRYAQQRLAIGNFTRGFDRTAEAVTALRIGVRLLDLGALEDSLASLATSVRLAEPRSLLALNAQMRLGEAKARREELLDEARKEYQELEAILSKSSDQDERRRHILEQAVAELQRLPEKDAPASV